jgi:hypothetical protein
MEQSHFVSIVSEAPARYGWFLGAGASQSAGLPTAWDIIWDLKRREYNRAENQKIPATDVQNQAVRDKIQSYLLSRGFPETGDASEYTRFFELIFGDNHERQRRYIRAMLSEDKIALALGQRVIGAMICAGLNKVVFTTNFDAVIETAVAQMGGMALSPFHLEGSYAVDAAVNAEEYPIYCKLHGDFRYQSIKNLDTDLRTQNVDLGKGLINACNRFGLIIAGYSGRDTSVMELLSSVLESTNPFPHGLFWTKLKNAPPLPSVTQLIDQAKARNVDAHIVEIETFDTMLSRIWRQLEPVDPALDAKVRLAARQRVEISVPAPGKGEPILRANAIPIESLPQKCLQLHFRSEKDWDDIKAAEVAAKDQVICTKAEGIWAWGRRTSIASAFGRDLASVEVADISGPLSTIDDHHHFKGFVEKAACRALGRDKPLLVRSWRSGYALIVDRNAKHLGAIGGLKKITGGLAGLLEGKFTRPTEDHPTVEQIAWAEAVQVNLETRAGKYWLLLRPDVWIWPRHAREEVISFLDYRRADRFNAKADDILSAWIKILLPADSRADLVEVSLFETGEESENPTFGMSSRTAFARRSVA